MVANCSFYAQLVAGLKMIHESPIIIVEVTNELSLNRRGVMEDMEMLSAFSTVLHVPNLSTADHLLAVLEEADLFSKEELSSLHGKLQGHR